MRGIVYTIEAEALAVRDAIDALACSPSDQLTDHYTYTITHPTNGDVALVVDATVEGLLPTVAPGALVVELSPDWFSDNP